MDCVGLVVEVLSDMSLHYAVADGNVKTGLRVSLDDSSQGHFIVREAGAFWKGLDMRKKVNSAVAEVREEVRQRRMCWCFNDIRRLIRPYPRHKHVDDVFKNIVEDTALEEGEQPNKDEEQGSDSGAPSEASKWSDAEDYEAEGWNAAVEALPDDHAVAGASDEEMKGALVPVSAESAELVGKSTKLMETYAAVAAELQRIGAVALAANVVKEQRKEAKRLRQISAILSR
jgi:hypothetical protein